MTASFSLKEIAWKRIFLFMVLILIPNILVMQAQLAGPVDDYIGLGTAIDLIIVLPFAIYFLGFRKRRSVFVLFALILAGLVLANVIIPNEADGFLSYFNYSVIALEAGVITFELFIMVTVLRKIPTLIKNFKHEQITHYHFLLSFSRAAKETFSFRNKKLNKFQTVFRMLATDIAAIYYSLFSWKKKAPVLREKDARAFTFHKDGGYFGVFIMIVHAMIIEVIAIHFLVMQFSHTAAWILTAIDVYALLFIIADYQAIRLSPVIVDSKGIHFQKGIRLFGCIEWEDILEVSENTRSLKEMEKDRQGVTVVLHGLEMEKSVPYVFRLNKPVELYQFFGKRKRVESIYIKIDEAREFNNVVRSHISQYAKGF